MALVLLAGGALAQTQRQTTVTGVFDRDTADLNDGTAQKLKQAADNLKSGNKNSDSKCFPPARTEFKTYSPMTVDPAYYNALSNARVSALTAAMTQAGLSPDEITVDAAPGNDGDVRVGADTTDRQGPILKVSSVPAKGTKVKAGDKITVTINASERYEDGHKNQPTGVQMIQLISNPGGLVDSKQFGRPPDPCARQSVVMTFTVPDHPPPVVHLAALAEDAVGNQSSESADFPTKLRCWKGKINASLAYASAALDFSFTETPNGLPSGSTVSGIGTGRVNLAGVYYSGACSYTRTYNPVDLPIGIAGTRAGKDLELDLKLPPVPFEVTGRCPQNAVATAHPTMDSKWFGLAVVKAKLQEGTQPIISAWKGTIDLKCTTCNANRNSADAMEECPQDASTK